AALAERLARGGGPAIDALEVEVAVRLEVLDQEAQPRLRPDEPAHRAVRHGERVLVELERVREGDAREASLGAEARGARPRRRGAPGGRAPARERGEQGADGERALLDAHTHGGESTPSARGRVGWLTASELDPALSRPLPSRSRSVYPPHASR